jgi:dihydrofolate reductase
MRKLIEATLVSLDGVVEGQERWTSGYFDAEAKDYAYDALSNVDTFLMGRVTYEKFSAVWPKNRGDKYFDRINDLKKLVASTTLRATTWNATLIQGEVAAEIARIKTEPGQDIMKYGTSRLDRTLVAHGLIDELHLWYFPVIVGSGRRLFEDIDTTRLRLVLTDIRRFKNGTVLHTYVAGR